MRKRFRLRNTRIVSQVFFLAIFLFLLWVSWTSRIKGFPVSRFLEIDPLVSLSTLLSTHYLYRYLGWSLFTVFLTLAFGRVFCGWVCPLGTLNHFTGWLFHKIRKKEAIESNRYSGKQYIKYSILLVFLLMSFFGAVQIGLLDPIVMLTRAGAVFIAPAYDHFVSSFGKGADIDPLVTDTLLFAPGTASRIFTGSFWIGLIFLLVLGANILSPRFFCRFLCPLGALLGLVSRVSLFRVHRSVKKCTDCDLCLAHCEGASDPQGKVRISECVSCMNCLDDCPEDALAYGPWKPENKELVTGPGLTRRQLVTAGFAGFIGFPLLRNNGMVTDENFSPALIRPPGSVEESEFLERCIKCGQCIDICPTNVLQPALLEEGGFEALWTPLLNFKINHCQLTCSLCSEVCPTGAIKKISVAEKLGKGEYKNKGPVRMGTAFVNRSRCLPWANQVPCVVCEEVCPTAPKAIQTEDEEVKDVFGKLVVLKKPFIVPDLCIGCGLCQARCPVADDPAVYVTAIGETRSAGRRLLLKYRNGIK
jgi:polyferredoxin